MGQVNVSINGRSYLIACDDGEEDHLRELAAYIDGHVSDLAHSVGQVGDARLMLMAGLLVADELAEAVARVQALEAELAGVHEGSRLEDTLAGFLDTASERIEALADQIS